MTTKEMNPFVHIIRDPLIESLFKKKKKIKSCFICGSQQVVTTPTKAETTFFKNILSQWRNDDNSETCLDCLPFIDKVWGLNLKIILLQNEMKEEVATAHGKGEERKVQRELGIEKIIIKMEEEVKYIDERDFEESFAAPLGEEIEPEKELAGPSKKVYTNQALSLKEKNLDTPPLINKENQCKICFKVFILKITLNQHLRNVHKQKVTEGQDDEEKYKSSTKKEFPCTICPQTFPKKFSMQRHMLIHQPEHEQKVFECHLCDKKFSISSYLTNHLRKLHNLEATNFKCPKCQRKFRFIMRKKFDDHVAYCEMNTKDYDCTYCKVQFKSFKELNTHLEKNHREMKNLKCSTCFMLFWRKYNLARHELTHKPTEFYCDLCPNLKFRNQYKLQKHLKKHENQEQQNNFSCHHCPKTFSVQQSLQIHLKFHSEIDSRPFACEECEVRFTTQEWLDLHLETHKEKDEFECRYCQKGFARKYNLKRHEFSHTNGRKMPRDGSQPIPLGGVEKEKEEVILESVEFFVKEEEESRGEYEGMFITAD